MRKFLLISLLSMGFFTVVPAQAEYIDPVLEKSLIQICEAIKSDKRSRLHMAIKQSGLNLRHVMKGLVCNGQDPISFARLNRADKTGKLIAARMNVDYGQRLVKN